MTSMIPAGLLRSCAEGCLLLVRVTPRASRSSLQGIYRNDAQSMLRVALQAPPVEGRANEALLLWLSKQLELPISKLSLARGEHAREKQVLLAGLSCEQAEERLLLAFGSRLATTD